MRSSTHDLLHVRTRVVNHVRNRVVQHKAALRIIITVASHHVLIVHHERHVHLRLAAPCRALPCVCFTHGGGRTRSVTHVPYGVQRVGVLLAWQDQATLHRVIALVRMVVAAKHLEPTGPDLLHSAVHRLNFVCIVLT